MARITIIVVAGIVTVTAVVVTIVVAIVVAIVIVVLPSGNRICCRHSRKLSSMRAANNEKVVHIRGLAVIVLCFDVMWWWRSGNLLSVSFVILDL